MSVIPETSQPPRTFGDSNPPPWDPRRVWRWGLFCGPYWTSLMAGLNILRLGQKRLTIWPVLIVVVGVVLALFDPFMRMYHAPTWVSYFYQVFLSFGAMAALWFIELNAQKEPYDQRMQDSTGARFKIPVLLGILPGLQLWAYLLLNPVLLLSTPTATQVCETFFLSEDAELVRPYCTVNMYQTIDLLKKFHGFDRAVAADSEASSEPGNTFQLDRETLLPGKPGRRRIDLKFYFVDPIDAATTLFDGYFEVQYANERWQIDELFFAHMNHQPFPQGKVRFEEFLKIAVEQPNVSPPDQHINQDTIHSNPSEVAAEQTPPQFPDDQFASGTKDGSKASSPPFSQANDNAATSLETISQTPKKQNEEKPFSIKPFHEWRQEDQQLFFRVVGIILTLSFWRFVFKPPTSSTTEPIADENESTVA